jgi:hypothetical protein
MVRAALGVLLLAGVAAVTGPRPGPALEVENQDRGQLTVLPLPEDGAFALVAWHSIYDRPVTEEYRARGDRIALEAVSSPSAAVREYFGLSGPGERHAVHREIPELVVRVAMGRPQRLIRGGSQASLLELGGPGDRLVFRPARRAPLSLLDP